MPKYRCPECGIVEAPIEAMAIVCPGCTKESPHGGPETPYNEAQRVLMKIGQKVTHIRTSGGYMVVGNCTMKNPANGLWQDAIIYMQDPAPEVGKRQIFVREREDFIIKFREKQ